VNNNAAEFEVKDEKLKPFSSQTDENCDIRI
jgi:hypothetical protein